MQAEYATVAVELDGSPEPQQHVPEQRIPRRCGHSERRKREQRRVATAHVFLLVSNHKLLLCSI
jgi:hypothetical protein